MIMPLVHMRNLKDLKDGELDDLLESTKNSDQYILTIPKNARNYDVLKVIFPNYDSTPLRSILRVTMWRDAFYRRDEWLEWLKKDVNGKDIKGKE